MHLDEQMFAVGAHARVREPSTHGQLALQRSGVRRGVGRRHLRRTFTCQHLTHSDAGHPAPKMPTQVALAVDR